MFPARFSSRIVPPILHHGGFRLNGRLLGLNARGGLGPTCRATADGLFIGFRQSNRRGNAVLDKAGQGVVTLSNDRREASRSRGPQIAAAATRHVSMAEARKARCVLAEMRWR